jgi:hypothetical protein
VVDWFCALEDIRTVGYKDIGDLVDAIEKISEDGDREAKT